MPFTKIRLGKDKGKYRSPSGRVFTLAQVKLYYETNGFKDMSKATHMAKGEPPKDHKMS